MTEYETVREGGAGLIDLSSSRGRIRVNGSEATMFLNGLITCDIGKVTPAQSAFAALLTPQGKIIVDFILAEADPADGGGFFLDCPRAPR